MNKSIKSFFDLWSPLLILLGLIATLISFNFLISYSLGYLKFEYILNNLPLGFNIPLYLSIFITFLAIFVLFYFDYWKFCPIGTMLIISGSLSNSLERLIFNGVRDYLDIFIAVVNFADLQLWTGLILLNYKVWSPSFKKLNTKSIYAKN